MSTNPDRKHKRTLRNFYAVYGQGPWVCEDCSDEIEKIGVNTRDGNIHHRDNDVTNDDAVNLVVLHTDCHQRRHPVTDELKVQISEKLRGRPSPTKGMKFPNRKPLPWQGPGNGHLSPTYKGKDKPRVKIKDKAQDNPFMHKTHTDESRQKMRKPRKRFMCDECKEEWSINWIERHKKEGKCTQRNVILINGVSRVRGILPKSICIDCDKPFADRWMQRHKDEGKCIKP